MTPGVPARPTLATSPSLAHHVAPPIEKNRALPSCPLHSPPSCSLALALSPAALGPRERARHGCRGKAMPHPPSLLDTSNHLSTQPHAPPAPPRVVPQPAKRRKAPPPELQSQQPLVSMARPTQAASGRDEQPHACASAPWCSTATSPTPAWPPMAEAASSDGLPCSDSREGLCTTI